MEPERQPEEKNRDAKYKRELARKYWNFVRPYRYKLLLIVLLSIGAFIVPLSIPMTITILIDNILRPAVDGGGQPSEFWTLGRLVSALGIVFAAGIAVVFIREYVTAKVGNTMLFDLRRKLYEHLQKLSPQFYDNRQVGQIVSRVTHDVNGAQNLINSGVINLVADLFMVIFAVGLLFYLDWRLALMALWILPAYYLTFTNINVRIRFAWRSVHRQMARIGGVLVERIGGMRIVQSFNQQPKELNRFDKQAKQHFHYSILAALLANILQRLAQSFNHIGTLLVLFVGGIFVLNGSLEVGVLVGFHGYLMQLYQPVQRFANVNVVIQNSLTNIERIFEVLEVEPGIQNKENAIPAKNVRGDITFEDVTFTYLSEREVRDYNMKDGDPDLVERFKPEKKFYLLPPKTRPDPPPVQRELTTALREVSFHAKAGEVVALVGPSGAGKSTLINLIPRFYDPNKGRILLDGVDLREYEVHDLREQMAMVLQENILFSGTVFENIAYGVNDATMDDVIAAAKAANAHNFIMEWKDGYETILGERGVRLSGGQKQRVAIARALLKNPRILILDEATSALDAESEQLVTEALETLMKNRTTFIIAHRLATVVRADQIIVLDEGQIVEHGSHEDLLRHNGLYRDLYEKQLKAMRPEELELVQ